MMSTPGGPLALMKSFACHSLHGTPATALAPLYTHPLVLNMYGADPDVLGVATHGLHTREPVAFMHCDGGGGQHVSCAPQPTDTHA